MDVKIAPAPLKEPTGTATQKSWNDARSCISCRQRKVRCDKKKPCSTCSRRRTECCFSEPTAIRKPRGKTLNVDLLSRLRRLEGIVRDFGAPICDNSSARDPDEVRIPNHPQEHSIDREALSSKEKTFCDGHGRLVEHNGRSRYISNETLARMGEEVAEMRDILDAPSDEEDFATQPTSQPSCSIESSSLLNHGFVLGNSAPLVDLKSFYPSKRQSIFLWGIYKSNVDPVIKIVHCPTAQQTLCNAANKHGPLGRAAETFMFAVHFAAALSLEPASCQNEFGCSKRLLVDRYRAATQQALAQAGFLCSSSLTVLQAFVIFISCLRNQDDTGIVSAFTSLAIHIARTLGLHRDGTNFGLSPYDTEMRRRLWWNLAFLETRTCEDHGTETALSEDSFDTQMPLNVNDDDMYPQMQQFPKPRLGQTEMTICIIKFELIKTFLQINALSPESSDGEATLIVKDNLIHECERRIEHGCLRYCDPTNPITRFGSGISRLVLSKAWILIHHHYTSAKVKGNIDCKTKEIIFTKSVEIIEMANALNQSREFAPFNWLCRTYVQWHALIFVLHELCTRELGSQYCNAWRAVQWVYNDRVLENQNQQKGMFWKAVRQLMSKVNARVVEYKAKCLTNRLELNQGKPLRDLAAPEIDTTATEPFTALPTGSIVQASDFYQGTPASSLLSNASILDGNQMPMDFSQQSEPINEGLHTSFTTELIDQPNMGWLDWSGFNTGMTVSAIEPPHLWDFSGAFDDS